MDASVGIAADDRPALERLLRYCARPCWASERLTQADDGERLIYAFDKPRQDGSWQVTLTPLELLDRLARFIPPPRRHLHRYHGVFAPHAALRSQVTARAGEAISAAVAPLAPGSAAAEAPAAPGSVAAGSVAAAPRRSIVGTPAAPAAPENLAAGVRLRLGLPTAIRPIPEPILAAPPGARAWARLIARIYEVDPLRCRRCGGSIQLIAFITERAVIVRILDHLGEPSRAPRMAPIRGPPCDGAMTQRDDRYRTTSIRRPTSCPTTRTRIRTWSGKPKTYRRELTSTPRRCRRSPAKRREWREGLRSQASRGDRGIRERRRAPELRSRGPRGMRAGRLTA